MKRLLRRTLYAGSAAACGIILWGAESASATDGDGGLAPVDQVQELLVDNTTSQGGTADISNLQVNLNVPVAIGSPGANSGDVDQSNAADNSAAVVNTNATEQGVEQSQDGSADASGGDANGGGEGGDGTAVVDQGQSAGVSNATDQSGDASVDNQQLNINIPVALLSPGANSGDVDQSNTADNSAAVINTNATEQGVGQSQSGNANASGGDATGGYNRCNECSDRGDGGDGTAIVDQDQSARVDNGTSQGGSATVDNSQENLNGSAPKPVPLEASRVGGGDNNNCGCHPAPAAGDVDQSNSAENSATVGNLNSTEQWVGQSQDGSANASGGDADGGDGGDGTAIVDQDQWAGVSNGTDQGGRASVDNEQFNLNAPLAIGSRGANSGDVDQSNEADNSATVINANSTEQGVRQSQTGDANASGGDAAGGDNGCGCEPHTYNRDGGNNGCNECSGGDGGDGGDGTAIVDQGQRAGVENGTSQGGSAYVDNAQENLNGAALRPVFASRDGGGDNNNCGCHPAPAGGDVDQSNEADNSATVINANSTEQGVRQSQTGDANASGGDAAGGDNGCGCEPHSYNRDGGNNGCNECSGGDGGDGGDGTAIVDQGQRAGVENGTSQGGSAYVDNTQENANLGGPASKPELERGGGKCGCEPKHTTFSGGDNHNCGCHPAPAAGDVDQSNSAENSATVGNINETTQWVGQSQDGTANASGGDANGGGDGGDGTAIVDQGQWAGVSNWTDQSGDAAVDNYQFNVNEPAKDRKNDSKGCGCDRSGPANGGDVSQSNWADNDALVVNINSTEQGAQQSQTGDANASGGDASGGDNNCGCKPDRKVGDGDNNCGCKPDRKGGDGGTGQAGWQRQLASALG